MECVERFIFFGDVKRAKKQRAEKPYGLLNMAISVLLTEATCVP